MPPVQIRMVVGLGNPGDAYRETRHNAGFLVLDQISEIFSIAMDRKKFDVVLGRGHWRDRELTLAKPQAYMNRSGPPVSRLAGYFKIPFDEILVVHDDIDLPFGRLQIKENGGHGGHNGIKSLMDAFGGGNFSRLRIGIGRSANIAVSDHVLGRFSAEEDRILDRVLKRARDAVVTIIEKGLQEGMNAFNQRKVVF